MKTYKRVLAVILCVVMTLTAAPLSGFVGLELPSLFDFEADAASYSGTCGDNLTWTLDVETGVLNISGTGAMENYTNDLAPWYSYRSNIKTVNISSGITTIGDLAFYSCTSLTSVKIPDSVTTIGNGAFCGCYSLASVKIPDSVITIGDSAFALCYRLTSVVIPESVTYVGCSPFAGCNKLESISVDPLSEHYCTDEFGVLYTKDFSRLVCFPNGSDLQEYTVPAYVSVIGDSAFSASGKPDGGSLIIHRSNIKLEKIIIPDSVTIIGDYAFALCDSLRSVVIGNSVTRIGERAFQDCDSLTSVTIPDSVTSISSSAFYHCDSLTDVYYSGTQEQWNNISIGSDNSPLTFATIHYNSGTCGDNLTWTLDTSTGVLNINGTGAMTDYNYYGKNYAPWYSKRFYIKNIRFDGGVTTIGNSTFTDCDYISSISIPQNITNIGTNAFDFCDSLISVSISANVKSIGDSAFGSCRKLKELKVDSNNDYFSSDRYGVLFNKDKSTLIQYPIGSTETSYTIPGSVKDIHRVAFFNTGCLKELIVPVGVTKVGAQAFDCCNSLSDVYYAGTKEQWENISIGSYNEPLTNATIHWPDKVVSENVDYYKKYDDNDYRRVTINATIADSNFSQNSAVYNHDLARLCSQFTVVGYTSGDGNGNSKNQVMKNALKKLGFDTPVVDLSAERTSVNHFITHKKIIVNGEEYTLIFMGFIGSYHEQWYSNFDPGKGATHQGFRQAANNMLLKFYEYVKEYKLNLDKNKTKFLITGHSRGAATANLVAADLIKSETFAIKENIYTYAFATPNSTTLEERNNAEYKRIFNIVNPEDFVTKAMPTKWGYGRYGTTYVLPSKTNTSNKEYKIYRANMQQYFGVLTNGEKYEPYIDGENATYCAVSSLTQSVKDVKKFYSVPLWAGSIPVTAYYFFQNSLCHFVSKTASVADYGTAAILILGTLSSTNSSAAYREILNYFVVYSLSTDGIYISGRFEDAHRAETYCAYMMSMSEKQIKQERKGYLNTINCPVDIEVIDKETGEVVGRIVNNVVDEEIAAKENAVVMSVDGDSKSFWLPSYGDYEVKLIGNDEGTMDYTVAEIDSDLGEQERINFFDVEITDGKEMTGDVPAEKFVLEEYTLKTDSGEETPDQKLDAESGEITITTSVEGDGYITNTLTVKSGDYVTLNAQPVVTAEFVKWVDSNGKTLSTDAEYSFVAKENTTVKAVFTTATGISIRTPSTTTVNYGDTLILHADFGEMVLPEGYSILWTVEGAGFNMAPVDDGLTCNMTSVANGNATVKATLVDENGEAVLDTDGNEMSDTQELKSNASFWQKIVSFFKNLFRINRIIPE